MKTAYLRTQEKPASKRLVVARATDPLKKLSAETGHSVEALRTFTKISDPAHASHFSATAARKAFAHIKVAH